MSRSTGLLWLLLALGLGAQELPPGMARYCVGLLKAAPGRPEISQEEATKIQAAHLDHLKSMAASGALVAAGPIVSGGDLRGVLIFRLDSVDKARELAEADPAVKSRRLVVEILPWMGPAGIGEAYAAARKADPELKDKMLTYQFVLLRKGPLWTAEETTEVKQIQAAHLVHIRSMVKAGKLAAAGPLLHEGDPRGIFIFQAGSLGEAQALAQADPAVKAGRLTLEPHSWLCADGVIPFNRGE